MVKRIVNKTKPYVIGDPLNRIYQVSSQFYPVDSGIMIEDPNT